LLRRQIQAARATAEAASLSGDADVARAATARAYELADELVSAEGALLAAAVAPRRAATVEVACALEGLADALTLATHAVRARRFASLERAASHSVLTRVARRVAQGDAARCARYWPAAAAGVSHLASVQRAAADAAARGLLPSGASGGFGSLLDTPAAQRCDVAAHAVCALLKLLPICREEEQEEPQTQHDIDAAMQQPPTPQQPGGGGGGGSTTRRLRGA
jgi:hypothetical protein